MIENRKAEHVSICATKSVHSSYNYWDDILFIHNSLPELNKAEIDLKTTLFNKKLSAPIVISGMTGGYPKAKKINSNLATAAAELQIGLGVGSQRPALESSKFVESYSVIKDFDIPLVFANIGAPQLIQQKSGAKQFSVSDGKAAMDMIGADLLAIHMNFVQEIAQPEGDTNSEGCLKKIKKFASELPVLAKETGAGISKEVAIALKGAGVRGIDVGGLGGTSFPAVETYRGKAKGDALRVRLGKTFWNWGIPTPASLLESTVGLPLISTGGIRTGLDVARALCLGASVGGIAGRLLKPALKSAESVTLELELIMEELRSALFLTGTGSVKQVNRKRVIIVGKSAEILRAMGYKY